MTPPSSSFPARRQRASVLIIVMVTLLFATFALLAFMEKAGVDLLVDQREAVTRRLRAEAYSALEVTLAVLESFREVGGGLRSPAEGWGNPLEFAEYTPGDDDRVVTVTFEDESGKISLPRANAQTLVTLFKQWEIPQLQAESLADALMGWMHKNHVYTAGVAPDYERGAIPYEAPGRPLRSYEELAAIDTIREAFFDEDGRPNDLWRRFTQSVSLFDFQRSNINGASDDALAAIGQFDPTQMQSLADYLRGRGSYERTGPGFFETPADAQRIAGTTGDANAFAATISALRVVVTVTEGRTQFRLGAVIAPPNGASAVQQKAQRTETTAGAAGTAQQQQSRPNAQENRNPGRQGGGANANARNLRYPFTLLEIRENDEIPSVPAPPPEPAI